MKKRLVGYIYLILFFYTCTSGFTQAFEDIEVKKLLTEYRIGAIEWLLSQKVPNSTVNNPIPQRRNLVLSYEIPEDDPTYPYLKGRAYVYDSALAAIAFTMSDRYREAEDVLLAMGRQLRPDGSLWFGVNVHNEWPSEEGHEGATVRSGASSWAGYAATFYLRKKALENPEFHRDDRVGRRILFFAEKLARHLMDLQITDPEDPRYGLITGGMGTYTFNVGEDGSVRGDYDDGELGWASTEHNIDVYFLFRDLVELTGGKKYARSADMVAEGLLRLWDGNVEQLIQGIKKDGRRDTVLPLDTSSWGSMMLRASGDERKAEATLEAGVARFQIGKSGHYRPYAEDPVFSDGEVTRAYFGKSDLTWSDLDIAWPEGSLGMSTALIKAGKMDAALQIIEASMDYSRNGALQYASIEVPQQFSTYLSVASTAWLVIAIENLLDPEDRVLFWSYP